jgi:propanol-preferring alcohol dehydrogenase
VGLTFLASACGECHLCRRGRERFCARQCNFGYTVDGALAGWAVAPLEQLARIPEELPAAEAAPLCCAGWTAYAAVRGASLQPGQSIALFGMGGLGHLAVQYARHFALCAAAVDPSERKLEQMRELGAEFTATPDNAGRALQKQYGGVDAAVVLTESPAAIHQAFRSLKRNGTLVLVGLSSHSWELPVVETVLKGITIRGSYLGSRHDLAEVFRLAQARVARPQVSTWTLAEAPALLERMRRGDLAGRAVVLF